MNIFTKFGNGQRPRTVQDWQALVGKMSRHERDRYWPGMHKDLIPDYEMIQDQDVASRLTRGPWDSEKSRYTGPEAATAGAILQQNGQIADPGASPLEDATNALYLDVKTGPDGADLTDMSEEILATFPHIEAVWAQFDQGQPMITSGRDGKHTAGSKHYTGNAVDVRARHIDDDVARQMANALQQRLGNKYDVDFEHFPENPRRDHIHVEYDPK